MFQGCERQTVNECRNRYNARNLSGKEVNITTTSWFAAFMCFCSTSTKMHALTCGTIKPSQLRFLNNNVKEDKMVQFIQTNQS